MSQWMTEVMALLQSRLDADILAGEIPKEYEVGIAISHIISASCLEFSPGSVLANFVIIAISLEVQVIA